MTYKLIFQDDWVHLYENGALVDSDHNIDIVLKELFLRAGLSVKIVHTEDE